MSDTSPQKFQYMVSAEQSGLRLDVFLSTMNTEYSRSFYQKLIKTGKVLVNFEPAKASLKVDEGDEIILDVPPPEDWHLQAEDIPIEVVYEDAHVLVVNKPAGMVVHPGAGVWHGTLVHALLNYCTDLSSIGGIIRPGIVHRLDKDTSGLLVVAKNDKSHRFLQEQFKDRSLSREYVTLVWGKMPEKNGRIDGAIRRSGGDRKKMSVHDDGKEAITLFEVMEEFEFLTLLRVKLLTGRTHQIRVHMKHIHHPVFGDGQYAGRESQARSLTPPNRKKAEKILSELSHQFLHAARLKFIHPVSGEEVQFEAPLPENLMAVLARLRDESYNPSS